MRSKKALYNIVSQFSYEIIAMICGLILPRIILSAFGSEFNGTISSILKFLDYISILTLGIAGSTRVAIYRAKGDMDKISSIVKANQKYMRKVAKAFVLYTIILAIGYPFIIKSSYTWLGTASLVIIMGIGVFAEYFWGVTYNTLLSAMQSKYISNIILIFVKIMSTVIAVILIKSSCSMYVVRLGITLVTAAGPIILSIIVNRKYKLNKDAIPDDNALSAKKDVMAHSIANTVHGYVDITLLTFFSNPLLISVYSVYTLILGSLRKLENVFTNGLEGAFGELWAQQKYDRYEKNFNTFEYLTFSFIIVLFSCTTFLLLPFIKLYTKNINDINYIMPAFAYLSIASYATYSLRTPYLVAVQSAGKYKETKKSAIMEAVLNLVISLILVKPFNLVGVTIGTIVANGFRTIQYELFASKNLIKRSNFVFIKRILWALFCFGLIFILQYYLPKISIISWKSWIINGFYYFVIAFVVTAIMSIIFYRNDFLNSIKLFKKMLKRKKVS